MKIDGDLSIRRDDRQETEIRDEPEAAGDRQGRVTCRSKPARHFEQVGAVQQQIEIADDANGWLGIDLMGQCKAFHAHERRAGLLDEAQSANLRFQQETAIKATLGGTLWIDERSIEDRIRPQQMIRHGRRDQVGQPLRPGSKARFIGTCRP